MDQSNTICNLNDLSIFTIRGPDAKKFLQGQLTCDLNDLDNNLARITAHCNTKGRVVSLFLLFKEHNDSYHAIIHSSLLEVAIDHLKKYGIFSKITIEPSDQYFNLFGINGNTVSNTVGHLFDSIPQRVFDVSSCHHHSIIKFPGSSNRYVMLTEKNSSTALFKQLKVSDLTHWQLENILAKIPMLSLELSDTFLPQMLLLDQSGGLNFKKGCFIGQEIIARTHHLGTLKQKLYLIEIQTSALPYTGQHLYSTQTNKRVGTLINVAAESQHFKALAMIRVEATEDPTLHLEAMPDSSILIIN